MDNVLEIKNVSKKIGKKQILKDISLEVREGEVFGFVGPNGAGKTTLIKTMLGLYKQDSGTIKIKGLDINKDFEKAMENIGAIIENPEMYDYLSGKDNLYLYSKIGRKTKEDYQKQIIKSVKLEERISNKVKTYSLGMRQRLGIAQALIGKPKLLILDEPTNGLDPIGIKELRELIKTISRENNIAVFVSSHILSEIELMCDRIAIIDNGEIIEVKDLNKSEIEENVSVLIEVDDVENAKKCLEINNFESKISDNLLKVVTTKANVPIINKILVDNEIKVYEIKQTIKTLEDEFIEKTKGTKGQIK
ncbi:MAG: ABC transporter ATP-binding protein [Bacilli bacterium]